MQRAHVKSMVMAFAAGTLFALGLGLGGMTRPERVIGFLDITGSVTGAWDPTLAFVMGGAIPVYTLAYRLARRRSSPLFASAFSLPLKTLLDGPLLVGAAVFGIGWGLVGYCPGPAITSVAGGEAGALVFVVAMLAGMAVTAAVQQAAKTRTARAPRLQAGSEQARQP